MKKIFLTVFALTAICFTTKAADTLLLNLDQSIEIARDKSYNMLKMVQDYKIAEYRLKATKSSLKTRVDMDFTLPRYTETVRSIEESTGYKFFYVKSLSTSGGLTVRQTLPTDGEIFLSSNLSAYDDYNIDNRYSRVNASINFSQPINSLYGYNNIRATLKRNKLEFERTGNNLKRGELKLVYDVSQAFYRLLELQKTVEIAALDLERQQDAYEMSKNKFVAGLIREVDALQIEVDLAQAQNTYDISVYNFEKSKNSFKVLLGLSLTDDIKLDNELKYKEVTVDPDVAVQLALENRFELRENEISRELQELNVRRQRAEGMVKFSVDGYYEKTGTVTQNVNGSYLGSFGDAYKDLTDRPRNFGIGFTAKVPILDWGRNRSLVKAEQLQLDQIKHDRIELERNIETEIRDLVFSVSNNLKLLKLMEKSITIAEKSFDITRKRFSEGDIDSDALAQERNRLNSTYRSHLTAYISYRLSLAELMQKTFYDFETDTLIK